jgi:hypothetical protein
LVGGRRAERVSGGEQHAPTVSDQDPGQFAAGGGLAGAVDADDHHHRRGAGLGGGVQGSIQFRLQGGDEFFGQ